MYFYMSLYIYIRVLTKPRNPFLVELFFHAHLHGAGALILAAWLIAFSTRFLPLALVECVYIDLYIYACLELKREREREREREPTINYQYHFDDSTIAMLLIWDDRNSNY